MATSTEIIRKAYFTAGILDPEDETPDFYLSEGLDILNELLADWGKLGVYVPYTNTLTFAVTQGNFNYTATPPIAQYFEGNIIGQDNILSSLNPPLNEKQFNVLNFSLPQNRPNNIYITSDQNFETLNSSNASSLIYIYPVPDAAYTMTLKVKQYLTKAIEFQEYSGIPDFYKKVLRYQLGSDLADYWQTDLPPKYEMKLQKLINELRATVPKDYSVNTPNPFLQRRRYRPWGGYVY